MVNQLIDELIFYSVVIVHYVHCENIDLIFCVVTITYFYFSDVPVWSKLETGRIPQPPELFQIIDNHIRLDQTPSWSDSI